MRPQQQNRRMRGRNGGGSNNNTTNNSNRKGPNPLTRNYESNGPDVKIRGSAQQIAEKYAQLARDAHSSGDRVMAENYLQHAEHYNRIIAAAQAQMPIQNIQNQRDASDEDMDDERDDFDNNVSGQGQGSGQGAGQGSGQGSGQGNFVQQGGYQDNSGQTGSGQTGSGQGADVRRTGEHVDTQQATPEAGSGPQPVIEGVPAEVALNVEAAGDAAVPRAAGAAPAERRSRRPRRGERKPETAEDDGSVSEGGLVATLSRGAAAVAVPATQEPAAEAEGKGDASLIDAEG